MHHCCLCQGKDGQNLPGINAIEDCTSLPLSLVKCNGRFITSAALKGGHLGCMQLKLTFLGGIL
jgi:hypothetical protein